MKISRRSVLKSMTATGAAAAAPGLFAPALAQAKPCRIGILAPRTGIAASPGISGVLDLLRSAAHLAAGPSLDLVDGHAGKERIRRHRTGRHDLADRRSWSCPQRRDRALRPEEMREDRPEERPFCALPLVSGESAGGRQGPPRRGSAETSFGSGVALRQQRRARSPARRSSRRGSSLFEG